MALTQVKTNGIADDAVTLAKQAGGTDGNLITYDASGNPDVVNTGNSGQVLTSNGSGAAPTFQAASGGIASLVADTSPQLGGDLDTNSFEIGLDDSHKVKFGDDNDLEVWHSGSHAFIQNDTGRLRIQGDDVRIEKADGTEFMAKFTADGAAEFYHNDVKKLETTAGGATLTGHLKQDGGFGIMEPGFVAAMSGDEQIDHSTHHKFVNWQNYSTAYNPGWDATNDKFTVPSGGAGKYLFGWKLAIGDNHQQHLEDDEVFSVYLKLNGSTIGRSEQQSWGNSGNTIWPANTFIWDLADSDYIEMYAWHDEGARVDVNDDYCLFWGFRMAEGD